METERRKSGGSAKTCKKNGKRTKTLTAEEEARRREVLKEKLREKLELEKRALKVVERLLEDQVSEDWLIDCAKLITPANYKDTVEERSIAKLCGYPICSNKLGKIPTQQFKISTKTNKVYDITERKCFCSNFCYKASKQFELQISNTPLWLRQHESPTEIKLMKKGDGGSSGEEVLLSERCLREQDIENPQDAQPLDPQSSNQRPVAESFDQSYGSDIEQQQDFVSSVVSKHQGPRVHWGDLPKRTDDDDEKGKMEKKKKQIRELEGEDETRQGVNLLKTEVDYEKPKQLLSLNADKPNREPVPEQEHSPDDLNMEQATVKIGLCSLSETVTQVAPSPANSSASTDPNPSKVSKNPPSVSLMSTNPDSQKPALIEEPGLNITQVGMSKRGASGLRNLLKNQTAKVTPDTIRLKLLECLRNTLKVWSTDETLKFLYGADHMLGAPFADMKDDRKQDEEEEEELDEDDIDDADDVDDGVQERPSAAAPDYETLRKESQQLELRVREFYKGTWILPEEEKKPDGDQVRVQEKSREEAALPLIDSQAQHLIQKRIVVEKLTGCLKNIVGPLGLTMSDVSTDLNNLVRTFRFTNTNIIHKTPEWTLITVALLHLLSEVSPLVREAVENPASVIYLNTLMEELGLQEQDLLDLVRLFKTPTH